MSGLEIGLLTSSKENDKIIPALMAARKGFALLIKNETNPYYGSKYADLAAIETAIKPALEENGLFIMQPTNPHQEESGVCVTIQTMLWHESGQYIYCVANIPYMTTKGKTQLDVHSMGSLITYFRRYLKLSFLDIVTHDDDDGNKAMAYNHQPNINWIKKQMLNNPEIKTVVEQQLAKKGLESIDGLNLESMIDLESWIKTKIKEHL